MGQKVKPIGLRVGINRTWDSRWYADRNYGELLHKDIELRNHLMERLKQAGISRVVIERPAGRARVTIYAGRPGLIIGKKGQDIEKLRSDLTKRVGTEVSLNIVEVRKPEIDAKLVGEKYCPAARTPCWLPPCYEACGAVCNAPWCTRGSD
jgi:small subunit ribosomal protein S3